MNRLDLAITYKCNNKCIFCYADCPRVTEELSTQEWKSVIDKIKVLGIPEVNFSGGEPTLRSDLIDLVEYASKYLETGIITNGRLLSNDMCNKLRVANLGHVQVTIHSFERTHDSMSDVSGSWEDTIKGIEASIRSGLEVMTNTTLMRNNSYDISNFVRFVYGLGIRHMCFNSLLISGKGKLYEKDNLRLSYAELDSVLRNIVGTSKELDGLKIEWLQPTCYKKINPISLGLGVRSCSACLYDMTVEPWGRVIPCQSWLYEGCGNILTDDWETILKSGISKKDGLIVNECFDCRWFKVCKGACPLDRTWMSPLKGELVGMAYNA